MSKYWALYDTLQAGEARFVIKQIDYTPGQDLDKSIRCIDKYENNIKTTAELLLNCWERNKLPSTRFTPSTGINLCVTGHSSEGTPARYEPWWQVQAEVEARDFEFTK